MSKKGHKDMQKCAWRTLDHGEGRQRGGRQQFARDVLLGFFSSPKSLPSRHFYDEEGNRLFQKIMDLPEYYLTDCELDILETHKGRIAEGIGGKAFNLVELGAGDGKKTRVLLRHLTGLGLDFRYVPIDICQPALVQLIEDCERDLPRMSIEGLVSEYFDGLVWISGLNDRRNVVLFLGSNIGNFNASEARVFLRSLWSSLNHGDLALVGFDLKKDIELLMRAYNDPRGVTAQFNLNLLRRINRELGGDFDIESFEHYSTYDVLSGAMESYLLSRTRQRVFIDALKMSFAFEEWEPIHTEVSHKYLPGEISSMASETGFEIVDEMKDRRGWFVDSLWRVRKP
jgi:dimethylhistidine N-methyltransferase